jgi:aminopeptidase N
MYAAWTLAAAGGQMPSSDLIDAYHRAGNLTDRLASVRLLAHLGMDGAEDVLAAFYDRHQDTPLVVDKWFAVQATIPQHATLDRVQALATHSAFSLKTPNRVYALIRSFSAGNPVAFNRPDGAGFAYIARIIGELDGQNPSVAARLATAFRSYRMLDAGRRTHAEDALRRLSAQEGLSRDVSDIVERTLGT